MREPGVNGTPACAVPTPRATAQLLRFSTMETDELLDRIVIDPNVCFGKPIVRGTRIWVGRVLRLLAREMAVEEILAEYPALALEDVHACHAHGARLSVGHYVDVARASSSARTSAGGGSNSCAKRRP